MGLYRHDRFLVLQDSRALLQALAQARGLEDFGHAHSRAVLLFDYVSHTTYVMPTEETTKEIFQSNLVDLLIAATSNGLRQLDQHWESPALLGPPAAAAGPKFLASLQAVSMLCHTLYRCNTTWMLLASHRDAVRAKLRSTAVDTGLLATLGPICNRLLPILQSLQQSADQLLPQLSASQWDVIVLAQSLLDMWIGLFHAWPSPALESQGIAATIEPAASISVALLQIQAAADGKGHHASSSSSSSRSGATGHNSISSSNSGSSGSSSSSSSYWHQYGMMCRGDLGTSRSLKVALTLAIAMAELPRLPRKGGNDDADGDADDLIIGDSSSRAPACCWSVHVQQLLLAYFAAVAAAQHSKLDQTAAPPAAGSTAARQQQIPKQHLKLLAAVHVPAGALTKCLEAEAKDDQVEMHSVLTTSSVVPSLLTDPLVVTAAVLYLLEHLDCRTRQGDAATKARLERWSAPVLLTCQELLLLGDKSLFNVGLAFHQFWSAVVAIHKHADQAGLVEVLRQMLHSLYPVVVEDLKQYTDGRTVSALREMFATAGQSAGTVSSGVTPEMIAQQLIDQWLMITCPLIQEVNKQDLVGIILQEPLQALAAVEAAVRGAPAAEMCLPVLSAFSVSSSVLMTLPAVITRLAHRTMDHTAERKVQKQLLSLLCSCYKVVANTTGIRKGVEPTILARTLLYASDTCVLLRWMQDEPPAGHQTAAGAGSSSSHVGGSSSTGGSAILQRTAGSKHTAAPKGFALIGRGMFAAGKLMQQENSSIARVLGTTTAWISGFEGKTSLQLPGDPVAAAVAKQKLLQKLDGLMALAETDEQLDLSGPLESWMCCFKPAAVHMIEQLVSNADIKQQLLNTVAAAQEDQLAQALYAGLLPVLKRLYSSGAGPSPISEGLLSFASLVAQANKLQHPVEPKHQCTAPQVAQLLQDFGALICGAIPLELCCNNPSCSNLMKLCELELVAGKGSRCSACKVARYCSKDCQKEHWKQHKAACKRLQG